MHRHGALSAVVTENCTKMLIVYKADELHLFVVDMTNTLGTQEVVLHPWFWNRNSLSSGTFHKRSSG